MLDHLVSCSWLKEHLDDDQIRILDCRFELGKPTLGYEAYLKEHIPNAVYVDLEKDMSSVVSSHGGRHPLPDVNDFVAKLGAIGIRKSMTIVAYDDQGGAMASRLWWLLKYVGVENVYVLDSSFSMWRELGYETSTQIPQFDQTIVVPNINEQLLANMEDVKAAISKQQVVLIDSRESKRFLGIEEPIDKIAGHIPTAQNYFWKDCLAENGIWATKEQQEKRFEQLDRNQDIIVYCGSGVTACPNVLVLQSLGFKNVKLYLGSWSDWISYEENEIAK